MATAAIAFLLIGILYGQPAASDELHDIRQLASTLWRPNLPRCLDNQNRSFPSKIRANGSCDDRDMVLFNGLLCASGSEEGCTAVSNSQETSQNYPQKGEWWRSPRIALDPSIPRSDSFSPDQNLGVMLAVLKKRMDPGYRNQFANWINWIDVNRPCIVGTEPLCIRGVPRFCRDDTERGCTLRPIDMGLMQAVLTLLQIPVPEGPFMRDLFAPFTEQVVAANIKINAHFNDLGFPAHLAGVEIMIMRAIGPTHSDTNSTLREAATALHNRQDKNPFFAYLAEIGTLEVAKLVHDVCPKTIADIPQNKMEWIWERKQDSTAPSETMLWDCMFMANLLGQS